MTDWNELIFDEEIDFSEKRQQVFEFQYQNNPVYRRFCEELPDEHQSGEKPPMLPVRAFKDAELSCHAGQEPELTFKSSGTSAMQRSHHLVHDAGLYRKSLLDGFKRHYDLEQSVILAYTPGYSDNPDSSLVWMLNELISQDETELSRFLPLGSPIAKELINEIKSENKQIILFGAAFGLLDLLEMSTPSLPSSSIVIETGGMKTHRREMSREKLHRRLAEGFQLDLTRIHSEYGMCEMLSQAYSTGGLWFKTPPWMEVTVWNPENPTSEMPHFQEGLIGVTDLANVHSCSFLLTGDKGVRHKDGRFKVLGRWNPKDLRGCNFLIDED